MAGVRALPEMAGRAAADPWHYGRVRVDPEGHTEFGPRETWLRIEEDVPATDVLDQYGDAYLIEAFLVAEEVRTEGDSES